MRVLRNGLGLAFVAGAVLAAASGCGGSQPDPGDVIDTFPVREGAYGTSVTIGDLDAVMLPQLVTSPDPPGRGIDYQKYQDRREVVNSVIVRVPVNEPESLKIRYYMDSRQVWTYHDMPVVSRTRIYAEEKDPFTDENHRTLLTTHEAVHGARLPIADALGVVFDYMEYRDRFGDVVTLIAESEVLLTEPGTPVDLVDPMLVTAPANARSEVRSNPLRIEFERRLVPPERPIILLPEEEDDEEAGADEIEGEDESGGTAAG